MISRKIISRKIRELEVTKARLEKQERKVEAELYKELAGLPAAYGFSNAQSFIKALTAATAGGRGRKAARAAAKSGKRRRRAVITEATRAEVKKLAEAGKTGAVIAKTLHISLPSVQNIKKALGLVKARKS